MLKLCFGWSREQRITYRQTNEAQLSKNLEHLDLVSRELFQMTYKPGRHFPGVFSHVIIRSIRRARRLQRDLSRLSQLAAGAPRYSG